MAAHQAPPCLGFSRQEHWNGLPFPSPALFPTFFNLCLNLAIRKFIIWATVSTQCCFCWLDRASPSLTAKNKINLISVLTNWWCPCLESSLVLLEKGVCYDQCILLAKPARLCPASFCAARPNLPVTPGISWLPTLLLSLIPLFSIIQQICIKCVPLLSMYFILVLSNGTVCEEDYL